jgi:hypothetical protein
MVLYKYSTHLYQYDGAGVEEFDKVYEPGVKTTWSGIYRCIACGHEGVHTKDKPLPSQHHHQHKPGQGKIQWKLVVTDSEPPS